MEMILRILSDKNGHVQQSTHRTLQPLKLKIHDLPTKLQIYVFTLLPRSTGENKTIAQKQKAIVVQQVIPKDKEKGGCPRALNPLLRASSGLWHSLEN